MVGVWVVEARLLDDLHGNGLSLEFLGSGKLVEIVWNCGFFVD